MQKNDFIGAYCACCNQSPADLHVAYKPDRRTYRIPMCDQCFFRHRINGAFLGGCLENMRIAEKARTEAA